MVSFLKPVKNNQKIRSISEENKIGQFLKEQRPIIMSYFEKNINFGVGAEEADDLVQETSVKFFKAMQRQANSRTEKWSHLLIKIAKGVLNDFFRKATNRKRIQSNDYRSELIGYADSKVDEKVELPDFSSLKNILSTKHRSLQEVLLIKMTKEIASLTDLIKNRFPALVTRVRRIGIHYETIELFDNGERKEKLSEKLENEIFIFDDFLAKALNKLKINDPVGQDALKALLLCDDPWHHWLLISFNSSKPYKSFNKFGKLIKKSPIRRPYLHFFRDYLVLMDGLPEFKKTIKYLQSGKYPKEPVDFEYINKFYKVGKINSAAVKKQKHGRVKRMGFKGKIKQYDNIIKALIENL